MKNKLYLLLITVMACFALSACGDSDEGTKEMKTYEYDNSGDVVIENDSLKLSVSGSSTQLEVTDKATGKVYRSNPTAEDVCKCRWTLQRCVKLNFEPYLLQQYGYEERD